MTKAQEGMIIETASGDHGGREMKCADMKQYRIRSGEGTDVEKQFSTEEETETDLSIDGKLCRLQEETYRSFFFNYKQGLLTYFDGKVGSLDVLGATLLFLVAVLIVCIPSLFIFYIAAALNR